jgi:lipopolysaccharide/colanic/teichoic acid biosynthesis glycosyltransferase
MENLILESIGQEAYNYIRRHVDLSSERTLMLSTTTLFNVRKEHDKAYEALINFRRSNDVQQLNPFFRAVNEKLADGGLFIGCVETYMLRKKRILSKYPPVLNYIYYSLDFLVKRIFPKLRFTRKLYFLLTRGNNKVLSKAETFGRLSAAGFRIRDEITIGKFLFFVAEKTKPPQPEPRSNEGFLIRLPRIGKNGKTIMVYKFRTMHAYSEYLQDYIYEKHALKNGGKFNHDFRISTLGRIMRKLWLDELPMLLNLLRGEVKLVGVRPLSRHYYELYEEDLREMRIRYRPGLIPPYYADLPETLEEIMASERKYLEAYRKAPLRTDFRYFVKALHNILLKNVRSS